MVTLKERPGDYKVTGIIKRDRRNDKGDGWDDTPYHKAGKHKPAKKREGCSGNDGGQHVYVWTRETFWRPSWRWNNWFWDMSDYEYRTCAGCYKHKRTRRKRVAPLR